VAANISIATSGDSLTISNNNGAGPAIDIVYFDPTPNNLISGIIIGSFTGTVGFQGGGNPQNLPSGNNALPPFAAAYIISATNSPGNVNRIDSGESLTVSATGGNLADLFNAGSVRLGLHVQSIGAAGASESLVAVGSAVPEPSTLGLGAAGFALCVLARRKLARS